MKHTKAKRVSIGILSLVALSPLLVVAADFRSGDQVTVQASERVNDDLYLAGGSLVSSGTVEGDLYAGGGTILVNGEVQGDVVIGGGNITLTADIGDDLRVGGGTVVIESDVAEDVVVGGGQVTISGEIGGDLAVGGGMTRVEGPVGGDVRIGGGDVYLNAPIAGDVTIYADRIVIGAGAVLSGNLTYRSPREAAIDPAAQILGTTSYEPSRRGEPAAVLGILSVALLVRFLMLLAGALLLGLLFRRYSIEIVKVASEAPLKELGRGFLILIALPIASLILLVTVIGIPLGLIGLVAFAGSLLFAWLMAPVLLGSLLFRWMKKDDGYRTGWKSILLGTAVFSILGIIPFVGWLAQAVLILVTLGAAMRLKWTLAKEWR